MLKVKRQHQTNQNRKLCCHENENEESVHCTDEGSISLAVIYRQWILERSRETNLAYAEGVCCVASDVLLAEHVLRALQHR